MTINPDDHRRLVKEHQIQAQRIRKLEQENASLHKENVITIKEIRIEQVEPLGYKQDMERLRELEKRNKELQKIIEYGNISSVSNIINEFKALSANQLERLTRELQFYLMCAEEHEELVDFIRCIEKISKELKKFLLLQDINGDCNESES